MVTYILSVSPTSTAGEGGAAFLVPKEVAEEVALDSKVVFTGDTAEICKRAVPSMDSE